MKKELLCFLLGFIFLLSSKAQINNYYGSGHNGVLKIYQKLISPSRSGISCSMYPSCSQYAAIEFFNKNPFVAYYEVCDRLMRCGNDLDQYSRIKINDRYLYKDTVKDVSLPAQHDNEFVNYLEKEQDYSEAILEIKRLCFFENDSMKKRDYLFRLVNYSLKANSYKEFLITYNKLLNFKLTKSLSDSLNFIQSVFCYRNKDYYNSLSILSKINSGNFTLSNEVNYYNGLCYIYLHKWKDAEENMKKILPQSEHYSQALNCYKLETDFKTLPLRKPMLGLVSSIIIPGSGYFYAKKPMTGITSLVLNGLFIWAGSDALHAKQFGVFSTVAVIGSGWYFGSILGSWKAVSDYNNNCINKFIECKLFE